MGSQSSRRKLRAIAKMKARAERMKELVETGSLAEAQAMSRPAPGWVERLRKPAASRPITVESIMSEAADGGDTK